jgi:hypothetical protein
MLYVILFVEIIIFLLVLFRLLTTNHWTIGKKLLVGLVSGVLVEGLGLLIAMICNLNPVTLILVKIPKIIISGLMVYYFYRNGLEIN